MFYRILFYAMCGVLIIGTSSCGGECELEPYTVVSITTMADDPTAAKVIDGNKSKTCDYKEVKNKDGSITRSCERNDKCTIIGPVICKMTLTPQKNGDIIATCDECK